MLLKLIWRCNTALLGEVGLQFIVLQAKLGIIVLEFLSLSTLRSGELVHLPLLELEAVCQLSK